MLILALETATRRASVLLANDDQEVASWRADADQDLCQRLTAEAQDVLSKAERQFDELDLVAVGLGPGSFTALRISLATAKAIALARNLPLIGVSSLQAMAWQKRNRLTGLVCPMLDAKREEIYGALYRAEGDSVEQVQSEFVASPESLAERLSARPERATLFGQLDRLPTDDIERAIPRTAAVWRDEVVLPDALAVAQLAWRRYRAHGADDIPSLRPIYVRMSYAEERFDIDLGLR